MNKVLILMSTHNGRERILKQVDSILKQNSVDVSICIRDDGSDKETKDILNRLSNGYSGKVSVLYGRNIGWKQSFLELVYDVDNSFDYYGFSDQDDIWLSDKVINCIHIAEKDKFIGPKLIHCNSLSVTSNLEKRSEQEYRIPEPPSFKEAIATEYFQGCGILWNNEAMRVLQSYRPSNKNIAHDYWVGLICYLFGKIYFCREPQFYHIRYENNSSEDGNKSKGRIKRLRTLLFGKNAYMNPAEDVLRGYSELLEEDRRIFLKKILYYKRKLLYKIQLIADRKFVRPSVSATLLMKLAILVNKF